MGNILIASWSHNWIAFGWSIKTSKCCNGEGQRGNNLCGTVNGISRITLQVCLKSIGESNRAPKSYEILMFVSKEILTML